MRWLSRIAAGSALTAGLALSPMGGSLAATPPAGQDPKVTVTPSTNLRDGSLVKVTATGYQPGETLYFLQCVRVQLGVYICSNEGRPVATANADAAGSATVRFRVQEAFIGHLVSTGERMGRVHCKSWSCYAWVGNPERTTPSPPLHFR